MLKPRTTCGVFYFWMMPKNTFKKEERLTNKKTFELLFEKGKSFAVFPFRIVWTEPTEQNAFPVKLGISVPKKSFAKAIQRNRIKRRIREAYRKNKHCLYEVLEKKNLSTAVMLIYTSKEEQVYRQIENKMILSLQKLSAIVEQNNNSSVWFVDDKI